MRSLRALGVVHREWRCFLPVAKTRRQAMNILPFPRASFCECMLSHLLLADDMIRRTKTTYSDMGRGDTGFSHCIDVPLRILPSLVSSSVVCTAELISKLELYLHGELFHGSKIMEH